MNLLPDPPLLAAFALASLVLALTPGPAVVYIVARSVAQGRRAGAASVAGVALGNFGNALGAALGLAALFAVSSAAFTLVKWAGAAYLVWLGVQTLRRAAAVNAAAPAAGAALARVFRDGFWVALLNPKTALFFAAFLPQFVAPGGSALQSVALGALCVAIAACDVAPALTRSRTAVRFGRWLGAGTYIGLGLAAALSDARVKPTT
jgi:threonine/homoserine/homoserine lactone efflux protein